MVYKLFLDSDVLLDLIVTRKPFVDQSLDLFSLRSDETVQLFTSSSIIINTQYIGEKQAGKLHAKTGMKKLLNYLEIVNPGKGSILKAYDSNFTDVEDGIQYFTALENEDIDYFITRNIKDFKKNEAHLPVLTPSQFLKLLK
jgi:predicted nucleic acid-binding protein